MAVKTGDYNRAREVLKIALRRQERLDRKDMEEVLTEAEVAEHFALQAQIDAATKTINEYRAQRAN